MSILVVDAGSSSMRGILFRENGVEIGQKQIKYHPSYGENGIYVEQEPMEYKIALWEILEWAGAESKKVTEAVQALSLTAQRSSCICMDMHGEPIGNAICWQDKRSLPICKSLEEHGREIFEKSGAWVNPVFLGPKLTWIRQNRAEVYAKTWKFMSIADYLMFLLTGNVFTDDTYASRTHLMNLETRAWDMELLNCFNVEREKLCEICQVGSYIGNLCSEVARFTGMQAGIPVYSAGGDQQCALVGQGSFEQGDVSVTLGTGEFIAMPLKVLPPRRKEQVIYNASAVRGEYIVEFTAATCCSALDWLMREIYHGMDYENMESELAKSVPGAAGCRLLPYFQGRVTPDRNSEAKAVFAGISLSTHKSDMLRALIEGIAVEMYNGIEAMPSRANRILVNGGLTRTSAVCQILADVLERSIYVSGEQDATALGAYIVTMVSLGYFPNEAEAYQNLCAKSRLDIYNPRQEHAFVYHTLKEENYELYHRIYEGMYERR
ncbi:MAG: hypothetical protein HDR17_03460 [Lachnospiraceae bacterium]|nr:hypothetical protein [Lachnospiraceae bacterium]